MKTLIRLVWEALFLSEAPYAEIRDGSQPVLRGLGIVVLVAVAVALVGVVGTTLEWATTPKMEDIQQIVLDGLKQMDWYQEMQGEPEFAQQFQEQWELGWSIFPSLFGPNVGSAALNIVLLPLSLLFRWLLYGVVVYLFARLLRGEGSLGQTLGCTALAVAPQMLNLVMVLPYIVVGGVVGAWTLLCRYLAVKTCHKLSWGRALAAALLPTVVWILLVSLLACLGSAVAGLIVGGGASQ
jgi:hypothetical protein